MRTTLSLDDDVAALIQRIRKARKSGLKQIVNEALRRGLHAMMVREEARAPYRTRAVDLGRCLVGSVDDVTDALSLAEGEDFK